LVAPPHPPPSRRLFFQREGLAVQLQRICSKRVGLAGQVSGPQREPQLLRLPALDAVQSLQRLGELPVQAGQATAPVLAGQLAG